MTIGKSTSVLNLAVLPAVATHWLAPRLPDFVNKRPRISINCSIRLFDFETHPFAAAIHYGSPIRRGHFVHLRVSIAMYVQISPTLSSTGASALLRHQV